MNDRCKEQIEKIMDIYLEIDTQIQTLQAITGLQCPSGCGKCCENSEVETTPLQMLPLAMELFNRGEAEVWLERAEAVNYVGTCIFYERDRLIPSNGRCGVYAWRPSICRLFGFAAVKNKQGKSKLAACKIHKQLMPEIVSKVNTVSANLIPIFSDFSMELANLDPNYQLMPINQALAIAINKLGLLVDYKKLSDFAKPQ